MSLNDGFAETFIFNIDHATFKVVINFTKNMYTVYAPNGNILLREEKVSLLELRKIKKNLIRHIEGWSTALIRFKGGVPII